MTLRRLLIAFAIPAAMHSSATVVRTATSSPAPAALSDFFKPGIVLQDRNADGVIDFVDVRVVLAPRPAVVALGSGRGLDRAVAFAEGLTKSKAKARLH